MANHPNRNWRKTWDVDLQEQTVRHQAGFGVVFERRRFKGKMVWAACRLIGEQLVDHMERERLLQEAQVLIDEASP